MYPYEQPSIIGTGTGHLVGCDCGDRILFVGMWVPGVRSKTTEKSSSLIERLYEWMERVKEVLEAS
jgi:hypothetical protein